jgi:hypothetical protein
MNECGVDGGVAVVSECLTELARSSGCEMHTTGAFVGGVGAQVATKLLLRQFVPLDNTFVHSGIHCIGGTYKL